MSEKERDQDQQHQRDASAQGVNRREFVGASVEPCPAPTPS